MLRRTLMRWFAVLPALTLPRLTHAASLRLPWRLKDSYQWEAMVGHHRLWCLTPEAPEPYHAGYCGIVRYEKALPNEPLWWQYNTPSDSIWGEQIVGVSTEGLKARLEQEFFARVPEARVAARA
jgi:hypothetical protein